MDKVFYGATALNTGLSGWGTSQVTIMPMFSEATAFNADLSDWDTSKVTYMDGISDGASGIAAPNKPQK